MALPGPFLAGQRLTAGQLNDATQKTIQSIEVGVAGIIASGISTVETTIAQLTTGPVDQVAGALYHLDTSLILQNSSGGAEFSLIVRKNTPLVGAIVTDWVIYAPNTTAGYRATLWDDFVQVATEAGVTYYWSLVRVAGSGTITVYGQLGTTNRSAVALRRVGYSSEFVVVT